MSKTKSFIFKGSQSFSSSKLDQIEHKFNKINEVDTDIYSNEIYLVLAEISDINIDNHASGELFDSLESNIGLYDSNRNFNSVPINDQESFLKYAYGSLPSEKNTSVF